MADDFSVLQSTMSDLKVENKPSRQSIVKQRSANFSTAAPETAEQQRAGAGIRRRGSIPTIRPAAAATGGPRGHAKVQAKLAEIAAFLPQIEAEFERVSAPGAGLSPVLSKMVQTQLQAAIGMFKSAEIATEAQIAEVKKSKIGAVRVANAVSQGHLSASDSCHGCG